jgi:hypothetical protein
MEILEGAFDALRFPALWRTQSTSSHAPAPKSAASMPMSCQPTHLLGHYTHELSMLCVYHDVRHSCEAE